MSTTTVLLIVLALAVPPLWGWAMHALLSRCWPANWRTVTKHETASRGIEPRDYQI